MGDPIKLREITMVIEESEIQKIIKPLKEKNITFTMNKSLEIMSLMGLNPDPNELRQSKMQFFQHKIMTDEHLRKEFIRMANSIALSIIMDSPEFAMEGETPAKETGFRDDQTEIKELINKLFKKGAN